MEIELLDDPTTELTVVARAALALSSDKTRKDLKELVAKSVNIKEAKAIAAATTVTEIKPEEVEVTGPAPLSNDTDFFLQADGSDDIDGPTSQSDADVIACAATAVADKFGIPFNDALNRLAEIQEWIAVEVA